MFRKAFPAYLAMGMSYHEYWEMDSTLVIAYREAEEIKNEKRNQELWLQGMYIYEALCDVAPILRPFGKKGTRANKYSEKPYVVSEKARKKEQKAKERKVYDTGLTRMKMLMNGNDKRMEKAKKETEEVSVIADRDRFPANPN